MALDQQALMFVRKQAPKDVTFTEPEQLVMARRVVNQELGTSTDRAKANDIRGIIDGRRKAQQLTPAQRANAVDISESTRKEQQPPAAKKTEAPRSAQPIALPEPSTRQAPAPSSGKKEKSKPTDEQVLVAAMRKAYQEKRDQQNLQAIAEGEKQKQEQAGIQRQRNLILMHFGLELNKPNPDFRALFDLFTEYTAYRGTETIDEFLRPLYVGTKECPKIDSWHYEVLIAIISEATKQYPLQRIHEDLLEELYLSACAHVNKTSQMQDQLKRAADCVTLLTKGNTKGMLTDAAKAQLLVMIPRTTQEWPALRASIDDAKLKEDRPGLFAQLQNPPPYRDMGY